MTPTEINAGLRTLQAQEAAQARLPAYMTAVIAFGLGVLVMGTAQEWRHDSVATEARAIEWRRLCADLGYSGFVAGQSDGGAWEVKCSTSSR